MGTRPRVVIYADHRKGVVRSFLHQFEGWLASHAELLGTVWPDGEQPFEIQEEADLLLVLGGDGSILSAARFMGERQVPTVGVNLGRLGFLAASGREDYREVLEEVFSGHYRIQERTMLNYEILRRGRLHARGIALNDVNLSRHSRGGMLTVELLMDGLVIADFRCDGLLVSTPTGSTAYSLAAGGPLLDPELEAFAITPICPHQLSHRPLVIPGRRTVTLRLVEGQQATVSIDGQEWHRLHPDERVRLEAASPKFKWISLEGRDFYARLRSSLGWGSASLRERRS